MRLPFRRKRANTDMARWLIRSAHTDDWQVAVGFSHRSHAEAVLAQLEADPTTPNGLTLETDGG
jgi:alpha-beta hydrolase superfamily lysophospholipase